MRIYLLLLFLCLPLCCIGQLSLLDAQKVEMPSYPLENMDIWLEMSFGKSDLVNVEILEKLAVENRQIARIDLVYSDYPKNQSFEKLNTRRLNTLLKVLPNLNLVSNLEFRLVRQTRCTNKVEAKELPHGIALYFIPKKLVPDPIELEAKKEDVVEEKTKKMIMPIVEISSREIGTDSSVIKFFERNGALKDSAVIITDLTYSMEPFTWQVLQWQQQMTNEFQVLAHVFFNDGDKKKDSEKELGKVGGIYHTTTNQLDSIVRLMKQVQANGDGGDIPENDLEVLLFAMEQYPDAKEYVLIADAKSIIRDWELLSKVNKPVRIILARTSASYYSIPLQYVELALRTQGSLYTASNDFTSQNDLQGLYNYLKGINSEYNKALKKKKNKE